ncbi:MAG: adenylate/guanylate cyclase domain-containing protein [Candidatus Aminicenantales bacterium]
MKKENAQKEICLTTEDNKVFTLPAEIESITLGRNEDCDISIDDASVSRYHARITRKKKNYILTDLGSHNGTRVEGKLIKSIKLKEGDRIQLGLVGMTFTLREAEVKELEEKVVVAAASQEEERVQMLAKSSVEEKDLMDSEELLMSIGVPRQMVAKERKIPLKKPEEAEAKTDVQTLERMSKVLFVLYEVSRQLHAIHDFRELLQKIMDLIFMVIDADYGFVILSEDGRADELKPMVVKYRDKAEEKKGELKLSRTIIRKVIDDKVALLTSNAMEDPRFDYAQSLIMHRIRSAICVPLWSKDKVIGAIQLDSVRPQNQFTKDDLELLKAIGCQMAMVIEQANLNQKIREEELLRSRLERFHSPQVIEMIVNQSEEEQENIMEPKDTIATILFADIVGFTSLSETMDPRDINHFLNQFFSRMTDIIFKYEGTLDKYIGDCLMAVFGAPFEKEGDAERAVKAALEMRKTLVEMREKKEIERSFDIRIGINTGRIVAGNIGSPSRLEYTVIGDPVNIASRLESIAEPNQILIGEATYKQVKGKFKMHEVGARKVKGKTEEITVYEVLDS